MRRWHRHVVARPCNRLLSQLLASDLVTRPPAGPGLGDSATYGAAVGCGGDMAHPQPRQTPGSSSSKACVGESRWLSRQARTLLRCLERARRPFSLEVAGVLLFSLSTHNGLHRGISRLASLPSTRLLRVGLRGLGRSGLRHLREGRGNAVERRRAHARGTAQDDISSEKEDQREADEEQDDVAYTLCCGPPRESGRARSALSRCPAAVCPAAAHGVHSSRASWAVQRCGLRCERRSRPA